MQIGKIEGIGTARLTSDLFDVKISENAKYGMQSAFPQSQCGPRIKIYNLGLIALFETDHTLHPTNRKTER